MNMGLKEKTPYRNDLKGKVFHMLTVLEYSHMDKNNGAHWKCICECGNESIVATSRLSKGHTKSCGCLRALEILKATKTHGKSKDPIYRRWASMKRRCNNEENMVYGGKGISYDPRWELFENFYEDMAEGFSEELEIDRIDVKKGYYKENCRWVTHNENNYNKNKQPNNTSGKTGVCLTRNGSKYRAYIMVNRKQIALGIYVSFEEAVEARKRGEIKYYGYHRE